MSVDVHSCSGRAYTHPPTHPPTYPCTPPTHAPHPPFTGEGKGSKEGSRLCLRADSTSRAATPTTSTTHLAPPTQHHPAPPPPSFLPGPCASGSMCEADAPSPSEERWNVRQILDGEKLLRLPPLLLHPHVWVWPTVEEVRGVACGI